jgi:hypothetical protein
VIDTTPWSPFFLRTGLAHAETGGFPCTIALLIAEKPESDKAIALCGMNTHPSVMLKRNGKQPVDASKAA